VLAAQKARLAEVRAERDPDACTSALEALARCAASGGGNLLELSVRAARQWATVGEISDALERAWGRHVAEVRTISGVYSQAAGADESVAAVRRRIEQMAARGGRRPRILVAKIGQDGHDRGQKVVASGYADLGFDVDIGPLFQTPAEVARQATENDVHIVGVSSLTAGHLTHVPELVAELAALGRPDIMVVVGGVIPERDRPVLFEAGAAAVFGPGTSLTDAAGELLDALAQRA